MFFAYDADLKVYLSLDAKGRLSLGAEFGNKYLTKREIEIVRLLLQGHSAKSVGLILKISYRTVESYVNALKLKFECNRKSDLIALFMKSKLYELLL